VREPMRLRIDVIDANSLPKRPPPDEKPE